MKKQIAIAAAIVTSIAFIGNANAQQTRIAVPQTQQQQQYVAPAPAQFHFGMQVELVRNYGSTTLRIVHVTWGSPAHQAGLEIGDEIRTVNGRGFHYANDSFHAVRMMNQFVGNVGFPGGPGGPGAPAVAAVVGPNPSPIARMVVRNVRNGQNVIVNVRPTPQGGIGAPAAAASAAGG